MENSQLTVEQKLARIAQLETQHGLSGLSFQRRNDHVGIAPLGLEESADWALRATERAVQLIADAQAGKIKDAT
jgi:hypothetical protein